MNREDRAAFILESMLRNKSSEPINLPLSLLKAITENFSKDQIIGRGGFGDVYKGMLNKGMVVAVKKLRDSNIDDKSFQQEVCCLMSTKHKNITRLLGYCADTQGIMVQHQGKFVLAHEQTRVICFEYVGNGCLDSYLTDEFNGLEWHQRYRIIKGICEGLQYLHMDKSIIHLDLKPSNILLDHNMMPKITDFGLARLFGSEQSQMNTKDHRGSLGYMAPEYLLNGIITSKADIYSLGVIIIKVITGRNEQFSVLDVHHNWRKRLHIQASLSLLEVYCEQVKRCIEIALSCMEYDRKKRPDINHILHELNDMETMIHVASLCPKGPERSIDQDKDNVDDAENSITMQGRDVLHRSLTTPVTTGQKFTTPAPNNLMKVKDGFSVGTSNDNNAVVLYTSSLGYAPATVRNCGKVRAAMESLGVKYVEKDFHKDRRYAQEVMILLGSSYASAPALFVGGEHVGGVATVMELYEQGTLAELFRR